MDLEEKKYWLAFSVFEDIGPRRFGLLLKYFDSAKSAFKAPAKTLRKLGLSQKLVDKFLEFRKKFDFDQYFYQLKKRGIKTVCLGEKQYPFLLKEIPDPPPLLYIKVADFANWEKICRQRMIAVVGTRKVSAYGAEITQILVKKLVEKNFVVVSGLARGVDGIAHQEAIKSKGTTVAVMGTGLDQVYPPEHKVLAEKIYEAGGALVSEFPLKAKITKGNFVLRNRIISGLSVGVIITEAAARSGSLSTASFAALQGREVFAVPGPVTSFLSVGTNELIKKGAKLVYNIDDILEEL